MALIAVEDVREALPSYQGLTDNQIASAIDDAEAYLDGVNPDWRTMANAPKILKLASASMTLQLHFPQSADSFTALDRKVAEMLTSMWSSSFMLRKKTRFGRVVNPE